jgi:hypothetical protein
MQNRRPSFDTMSFLRQEMLSQYLPLVNGSSQTTLPSPFSSAKTRPPMDDFTISSFNRRHTYIPICNSRSLVLNRSIGAGTRLRREHHRDSFHLASVLLPLFALSSRCCVKAVSQGVNMNIITCVRSRIIEFGGLSSDMFRGSFGSIPAGFRLAIQVGDGISGYPLFLTVLISAFQNPHGDYRNRNFVFPRNTLSGRKS